MVVAKADGCDLIKGLKESTKLLWSGDVDLADGSLQKQYEEYRERLKNAEVVALERQNACSDLEKILDDIKKDLKFLHAGIIIIECTVEQTDAPLIHTCLSSSIERQRDALQNHACLETHSCACTY